MARRGRRPNRNQGSGNIGPNGNRPPKKKPAGRPGYQGPQWGGYTPSGGHPAGRPGAASAPTGPPGPVGPPPPDWQEIAARAAEQRNTAYQGFQSAFDRGNIGREYGFLANGAIDPNNPNSRAAMLQRSYQQGQTGDNTSFAAQGQLYSGAYQNQINDRTRGYNTDNANLQAAQNQATGQTYLNQFAGSGGGASPEQIAALLRALGQG
jgi:hypothetical protein